MLGPIEPGDDAQQRRLAATGGPEQHDRFAGRHVEVDVAQRDRLARARPIGPPDAAQGERRRERRTHARRAERERHAGSGSRAFVYIVSGTTAVAKPAFAASSTPREMSRGMLRRMLAAPAASQSS